MTTYSQEEKLDLTDRVYITKIVKNLINKELKTLKKNGQKISAAKLVCNLIIEKYGRK